MWPLILAAALCADNVRDWTDPSGQFYIEASLVEVIDQQASLKKPDGTAVQVSVSRLGKADREYLNGVHTRRATANKKGIASRRAYLKKHHESGNKKGIAYEVKFIKMLTTERTSLKKGDIPRKPDPPPLPKPPKKPPPPVRSLNPLALAVGQKGHLLDHPPNTRNRTFIYRIVQVSDDGVLVRVSTKFGVVGREEHGPMFFLSGISTKNLVDDQQVAPPPIVHVKGVKKYVTVLGSTASVFHLVPAERKKK